MPGEKRWDMSITRTRTRRTARRAVSQSGDESQQPSDVQLHTMVLVTGLIGTSLIVASLFISRVQMESQRADLDQISSQRAEPLSLLNEAQAWTRAGHVAFLAGVDADSSGASGAYFADALADINRAGDAWAQFSAIPPQFDGEQETREAIEAASDASAEAGEAVGVAVLASNRDEELIARLTGEYQAIFSQLDVAYEQIESDFYRPALSRDLADLRASTDDASQQFLVGMLLVTAMGALLTTLGFRRAARFDLTAEQDRHFQHQIADENELDAQLQQALDMAETEDRVIHVLDRALGQGQSTHSFDLLLADSSTAPFEHVIAASGDEPVRCPVASPMDCPVTRHGHELVTADSEALNACTYLLERDDVPASALCVPVSISGFAVGVIHEAYPHKGAVGSNRRHQLEIIARKAGERLGTIRAFAQSENQAHTDPLTGLLNRRSLDVAVERLAREHLDYSVAFADLDHFKVLNDTYGHDAGDRALRLFCTVLRTNVRPEDIVARYGGEEFVVVLPSCAPAVAVTVLQRVQAALADMVRADGVPPFTVSIGVASNLHGGSFDEVLAIADGCLLHAKDDGRNRIIVAGVAEPYLGPAPPADDARPANETS